MRALRINETKVAPKNTFTDNLFTLESDKELKKDEKILIRDCPGTADLTVNP